MQLLFALTLLVSATLLFLVQPMFAKMVLPNLGGTPAVWNTCMVFYQAVLLIGYLYAHLGSKWLGVRRQAVLHIVLLAIPWVLLPIMVRGAETWQSDMTILGAVLWLLWMLAISVGLPFLVVSATAPMLQAWFANTGHRSAKDPYFLYAASNLGSMLALVSYPTVVEPYLSLKTQTLMWCVGYGMLAVLIVGCAVALWRSRGAAVAMAGAGLASGGDGGPPAAAAIPWADWAGSGLTAGQRLRWIGLAFAPSSLLLGVTTFASTDLASLPLLWIVPLTLYLLTFVLVFARRPLVSHFVMVWLQPFMVAFLAVAFYQGSTERMPLLLLLHLAAFFVTTLVCHGELARSRPPAEHLTEFYIWMSFGGVLGGLFNALVAPLLFSSVVEYPLVIAVACMLRPQPAESAHPVRSRWMDLIVPLWLLFLVRILAGPLDPMAATQVLGVAVSGTVVRGLFVVMLSATGLIALAYRNWGMRILVASAALLLATAMALAIDSPREGRLLSSGVLTWLWQRLDVSYTTREAAVLGIGAIGALACMLRPVRFGLAIGAVLLAGHLWYAGDSDVILQQRSFFGVLKVKHDAHHQTHALVHGSTTHGLQSTDPARCQEPLSYYCYDGPLGTVFDALIDPEKHRQIGVIGLGTGTTAAYAHKGQEFTYFEIDPAVVRIAGAEEPEGTEEDPAEEDHRIYYFTYVYNARGKGADVHVVLGDARLSLVREPDGRFDMLVVDAFSSDAIPIHLLTRESLALYFQKLKPDGILMVHVSNRYLDLAPVVGNIARAEGWTARVCDDRRDRDGDYGMYGSEWVAVVRRPGRLGELLMEFDWKEIPADDYVGIWTDDFSNILSVLTWWRHSKLCRWIEGTRTAAEPPAAGPPGAEPPAAEPPAAEPPAAEPPSE